MRIVAIETSGDHGSVATLFGDAEAPRLMGQAVLPASQRSAQSLAPALQQLLVKTGWPANSIELVVVAAGPGSFTGLRIGVTTAKTLAYATGAQVLGVNTLRVLAQQAEPLTGSLWTVMDAQRGEFFVAKFQSAGNGGVEMVNQTSIVPKEVWLGSLRTGDRVTGPSLLRVLPLLPQGVGAVSEELWKPNASAVGRVGWHFYLAGCRDNVWKLLPQYYRPSAAEEKWINAVHDFDNG
jgi:tRNA threonylcarbamoyladenosine biosynthesis protein TsaB